MAGLFQVNTRTSNARRFAEQLIAQGSQTTPVATPLAAVARAVQGLTGGFVRGQQEREGESLAARQQQALARALAPRETGPGGAGRAIPPTTDQIIQSIGQIEGADPNVVGQLAVSQALAQDKARTDTRAAELKFGREQAGRETTASTLFRRQTERDRTKEALKQSEFQRAVNRAEGLRTAIASPQTDQSRIPELERRLKVQEGLIAKKTTITGRTPEDISLTPGARSKQLIALDDDERAVASLVRGSERVFELLDQGTEIGFTGALVSAANSFASQAKAAANAAGKIFVDGATGRQLDPSKLLDPKRYNFGNLSRLGQDAARVRATMTSLAFALASQQNKGRISDRDVQAALTQLGADVGDKEAFKAILTDRISDTIAGHNLQRSQAGVKGAKDFGFKVPEVISQPEASPLTVPSFKIVDGQLVPM